MAEQGVLRCGKCGTVGSEDEFINFKGDMEGCPDCGEKNEIYDTDGNLIKQEGRQ